MIVSIDEIHVQLYLTLTLNYYSVNMNIILYDHSVSAAWSLVITYVFTPSMVCKYFNAICPTLFCFVAPCTSPYRMVTAGNSRKCIFRSTRRTDWNTAKRFCENDNAHLLTFSSGYDSKRFGWYLSNNGEILHLNLLSTLLCS